ncbi:MBL fold metallo-hydrolase [Paenibacillus sp. BK720]|uniref:MBL fold metallo-hydrolase n=1 Tax=Paenibacillus sp. BK720 TaxID=2587092 RepID=UPI0014203028|nr:MBL fold metallo-hydrolase [Paenibacillus sp. BK720]NIK72323.1 glyoxylase-like metal-dependent hydrolase (beta-lactamase superfamily II) [Paenibacillus sp. BK720]
MRIADGIEMLELDLGPMTVCPTVIYDKDEWVLVDTGMPGSASIIIELAKQAGIGERKLNTILLTHQDLDHIGGLPGFKADNPELVVYAHEDDRAVIDGRKPMLKASPERIAGLLGALPETARSQFEATFIHPTGANVNRSMADGENLPFAGGITVIHTPGHTPGHVSLYHRPSKTLIAGDAMVVENGQLNGPREAVTPDMATALQSLKKLQDFEIETVICYHGGVFKGDVRNRIAALTEGL